MLFQQINDNGYKRLVTREVKVGDLLLGNLHPVRVQTMTTTDTMNTLATVEQSIRCIEAGAELVRITAPSKKEAENLRNIKDELVRRGYNTPLVADIHFTPNAAEIAARIVEKVRVNPGNYVDKKKFELIEYTDADYAEEIERITERFTPLVRICKEYGTAMRIGTNHGSLSDRIMSRYGDTPMGMVESAMEFLRVARYESYHNIVLSMKSSNPQVMVQAYRMLVEKMFDEFGECYPLHLGVTEAGDGEDGRIKSAIGIGSLLEEGLGDTIRVSLTEDPEFEIPVCKDIVKRYGPSATASLPKQDNIPEPESTKSREEEISVKNNSISDLSAPTGGPRALPTAEQGPFVEQQPSSNTETNPAKKSTISDLSAPTGGQGASPTGVPETAAKALSRSEGREDSLSVLEEETVGYRYADPQLYGLLKTFSEQHRSHPTDAEDVMWDLLKTKKLEGYKFRRQHIIDRFITDFVCLKQKLVIELDGLIHQLPENLLSDQQRTDRLSELGFSVIRFTNEQVLNDTDQTVQKILSALKILQAANQTETNPAKKSTISDLSAPTGGQGASPSQRVVYSRLITPSKQKATHKPPEQEETNTETNPTKKSTISDLSAPTGGQGALPTAEQGPFVEQQPSSNTETNPTKKSTISDLSAPTGGQGALPTAEQGPFVEQQPSSNTETNPAKKSTISDLSASTGGPRALPTEEQGPFVEQQPSSNTETNPAKKSTISDLSASTGGPRALPTAEQGPFVEQQPSSNTETNPAKKSTISDLSAPTGGQGALPTAEQGPFVEQQPSSNTETNPAKKSTISDLSASTGGPRALPTEEQGPFVEQQPSSNTETNPAKKSTISDLSASTGGPRALPTAEQGPFVEQQPSSNTETNPAKKSTISDLSAPTGGQGASPTGGQGASPIVIADLSKLESITQKALQAVGYTYNSISDKWSIADGAADFIFTGHTILDFALPGTLKVIVYPATWLQVQTGTSAIENVATESYVPIFDIEGYLASEIKGATNFVMFDSGQYEGTIKNLEHLDKFGADPSVVLCLSSRDARPVDSLRLTFEALQERNITNRTVLVVDSDWHTADEHLVHYAIEAGALLLEGLGNGICLGMTAEAYQQQAERFATPAGRGFLQSTSVEQFLNNTAFSILQATRRRISKTEYISCPSCGRTLFDLQETTAKIRAVTNHLKGVKIAIMGCIVNGPGEMADADFGYVGSGPGKITLYKGKEVVKRNVPSEIAVQELIQLLKDCHAWIEPQDVFDTTIKEEAIEKT